MVVGIDLDPIHISSMVGESTTEISTTIPVGTATSQPSQAEGSTQRGKTSFRLQYINFLFFFFLLTNFITALERATTFPRILPREDIIFGKRLGQLKGWKEVTIYAPNT